MTIRRYYTDSYTRAFTARVIESCSADGAPAAVLDETFFYPTSGGQPHDTGSLDGAGVVDVSVRENDGALLHRLDRPVQPGPIEAQVDWARRFDHMQQHSGQHILSQAFLQVANAATIGFHLGAETVSIDLATATLSEARIADAAALANTVVSDNLPIRAWFPGSNELVALALRKAPDVAGPIRVVAIGSFDHSACGGTHVAATGEIGLISVLRTEKFKRGVRVEFLCGSRARSDYAAKHAIVTALAASLTCAPAELSDSVARLQAALADSRRRLALLEEGELDAEAEQLLGTAPAIGPLRIVRAAWDNRTIEALKGLALRLTGHPDTITLLGATGRRTQLVFGRAENLTMELKPIFDRALAALGGGRGGGTRILQGAAESSNRSALEAVLAAAAAEVTELGR
jgi:alanyl-tRNA synthetase